MFCAGEGADIGDADAWTLRVWPIAIGAVILLTVPFRPGEPRLRVPPGEDGFGPWQTDERGREFREAHDYASVFVEPNVRAIEIPMKLGTGGQAGSAGLAGGGRRAGGVSTRGAGRARLVDSVRGSAGRRTADTAAADQSFCVLEDRCRAGQDHRRAVAHTELTAEARGDRRDTTNEIVPRSIVRRIRTRQTGASDGPAAAAGRSRGRRTIVRAPGGVRPAGAVC